MRFRQLMLALVALTSLIAVVRGAEVGSPSNNLHGWQELSLSNAADAHDIFEAAAALHPDDRETRLGAALALLQLQSRTPGKIAEATQRLESLRTENPSDDVGIGASYYLARIAQLHSFTPDRATAIAGYRALIASYPSHHYAQLAAPKLAILLLYDDVPVVEWNQRAAEIAALIPQLKAPEAIRDTRLTLAMAYIRIRHDPTRAYPLFAACVSAGTVTRLTRINTVLLLAAECAHQQRLSAAAAGFYAQFLEDFPQDVKSDEVRRRLAALRAEGHP